MIKWTAVPGEPADGKQSQGAASFLSGAVEGIRTHAVGDHTDFRSGIAASRPGKTIAVCDDRARPQMFLKSGDSSL